MPEIVYGPMTFTGTVCVRRRMTTDLPGYGQLEVDTEVGLVVILADTKGPRQPKITDLHLNIQVSNEQPSSIQTYRIELGISHDIDTCNSTY